MSRFQKIKGTQDLLPEQTRNWTWIENVVRYCMELYNYGEMRTPIFEKTELFARGIGQLTDIVSKEMYTFIDRGKKSLTLKPEMTAPIMRAYLENNMHAQAPLQKIFYISPLFRQENPQAGRLRQFNQFGAEAIGSPAPELDAEMIVLASDIYTELEISNLKLKINTVGDPACREPYKVLLKEYFEPLLDQYCPDCQKRYEGNPMRILDCKNEKCHRLNGDAPRLAEHLCEDCNTHFTSVKSALDSQEIDYEIDPFLVRGLDYYTRTVFEISSDDLGAQNAICGGGRYDLLAEDLGGPAIPAVGFASGIERLLMVMEAQGNLESEMDGLEIFMSPLGEMASKEVTLWLTHLRRLGYRADRDYLGRSLKAQMREANRQKAKLVFLLGDNELAERQFTIKEMEKGEQRTVGFDDIEAYLEEFFGDE